MDSGVSCWSLKKISRIDLLFPQFWLQPFFPTPDVSTGYQRKEICAIRKKKKKSALFAFSFSFIFNSAKIVDNGFRCFPWEKERKGKAKKRKEKNSIVQHQSLFSHFFCLFSFLFLYFKRPFCCILSNIYFFNLWKFGIIILNVFVVTIFFIFCNKSLGKALIFFSSVN